MRNLQSNGITGHQKALELGSNMEGLEATREAKADSESERRSHPKADLPELGVFTLNLR